MDKFHHKRERGEACKQCKTAEPTNFRGHVYWNRELANWMRKSIAKTFNTLSYKKIETLCKEDDARHKIACREAREEAQRALAEAEQEKSRKRQIRVEADRRKAKRQNTNDTRDTSSTYVPDTLGTGPSTPTTEIHATPEKKTKRILPKDHPEHNKNPLGISDEFWAAATRKLERAKMGPEVTVIAATKEVLDEVLNRVTIPLLEGGTSPTVRISTPPRRTQKCWIKDFETFWKKFDENESRTTWPKGECPWFVAGFDDNTRVIEHITTMLRERIPRMLPLIQKLRKNTRYANTWETAYKFLRACVDNMVICEICSQVTYPTNNQPVTQNSLVTAIFKKIRNRLAFGLEKYKHGIQVDTNTISLGTIINSWLEMSEQELLDGMNYISAHLCRLQNTVRRAAEKKQKLTQDHKILN